MPIFFILFVVVPIVELWLFIQVGGQIGALSTIGLVILTAAIGSFLLKKQGASTLRKAQEKAAHGQVPVKELGDGIFLAIGGVLLLTPGFLTDIVGVLCLTPGFRAPLMLLIMRKLMPRFKMTGSFTSYQRGPGQPFDTSEPGSTFEGEYTRDSDDKKLR